MSMAKRTAMWTAAAAIVCIAIGVTSVTAQEKTDKTVEPPRVVVLDTYSNWRMHTTLASPVLTTGEPIKLKFAWLNYTTPDPDERWRSADFDDRFWNRGPATLACKTALGARLCLRGKFTVTDPAQVKDLKLSVGYKGGLIVTVNGKEVHRAHIARGKGIADGLAGQQRSVEDLGIPKRRLRKGMNVIGLEVVRSSYPKVEKEDNYEPNACELVRVRLSSASETGLAPCAARPQGLQVWNVDVMAENLDIHFGDAAESLRPVMITGAKNGMFSGKVMVGSTQPIRNLKVTPGVLKSKGGVIPASNVRIRYGVLWSPSARTGRSRLLPHAPYPAYTSVLDALTEQPPDEFAVMKPTRRGRVYWRFKSWPGQPKVVPGAVVPVWITVKVPADVKAGTYAGSVKIEMTGEKSVTVPVELAVADYTLPDTQDYRTWVDMIQCPDTLSLEYDVPLWSEKHWEMIAQSFRLIGETGSRTVYIPLIGHTNIGNEESMVRWVKKGDGYEHDFSIMERYLDVATKNMGKPKLLIFVVWDHYMIPAKDAGSNKETTPRGRQRQMADYVKKVGGALGQGPMVTTFDPATQKTELVMLPAHADAETSKVLWKPLFDELRVRLTKRGLQEKRMLGIMSDAWATKQECEFFNEITDKMPWVIQSHEGYRPQSKGNRPLYGVAQLGYQAVVWPVNFSDDGTHRGSRDYGKIASLCGWKGKKLVARFNRSSGLETSSRSGCRFAVERNITGAQRGQARVGADYWKVLRNKRGARVGRSHERYPESNWRNLTIRAALLAPGPTGPVATSRMEAFREGIQDCEARIAIERGLYDEQARAKLSKDLIKRCEDYLHARHMMMWLSGGHLQCYHNHPNASWRSKLPHSWGGGFAGHNWFLSSGWQERTATLYSLAGEVTRAIEAKVTPQN